MSVWILYKWQRLRSRAHHNPPTHQKCKNIFFTDCNSRIILNHRLGNRNLHRFLTEKKQNIPNSIRICCSEPIKPNPRNVNTLIFYCEPSSPFPASRRFPTEKNVKKTQIKNSVILSTREASQKEAGPSVSLARALSFSCFCRLRHFRKERCLESDEKQRSFTRDTIWL